MTDIISATTLDPSTPRPQRAMPIVTMFLSFIAASSSSEAAWPILLKPTSIDVTEAVTAKSLAMRMASTLPRV